MVDIIEDLSQLTTIKKQGLNKLVTIANTLIVDAIAEADSCNKDKVDLDIGIGTLQIINGKSCLEYRFIPSSMLEKSILKYFSDNKNPLSDILEQSLADKIIKIYKDVI